MVECPFGCGFRSVSEYATEMHIEERHNENLFSNTRRGGDSSAQSLPRIRKGSNHRAKSMAAEDMWTRCTRPGCGEDVLIFDIDEHLDMHAAALLAENEDDRPRRSPNQQDSRAAQKSPRKLSKSTSKAEAGVRHGGSLLHYFSGTSPSYHRPSAQSSSRTRYRRIRDEPRRAPGRLGKRELGPYAFEESMPYEIRAKLIEGSEPRRVNQIGRDGRMYRRTIFPYQTAGIIPVLADLCALDRTSAASYFCHEATRHIFKIPCNGNFCGYWNIQVLLSYVQSVTPDGPQVIPNVLELQKYIHQAWDRGLCPYGKIETGGVLNTRKWIGTHEALAFFTRIGVEVDALGFGGEDNRANNAAGDLLDHVEAYFMSDTDSAERHGTSHITDLPPIYFQRFGHSMTIVGIERLVDGSRNLFVFDSSFATSTPMKRLADQRQAYSSHESLLRPYRKSELSLTRWDEFEIIVPHAAGSANGK